ncbi:ParB/RepB/Spo0J family partition protein [Hydrogenophaga sp.]|uniref:ParB/RepB/Spo0J family partition protein n=1 Tax=Hydrogenophaga sp. TaxID=1904254 RepID=UPI002725BEAC|nr:ParB/RepB/Spo0J family partition protein [Hydrogenophaga sp.]MDO8903997.1 ParB/RepB/Spo0J family partition protein [Hydrogenophaga sp.]
MTTETTTITIDDVDALVGSQVQINHDCTDLMTENPHMWAGKYGTLKGTTPFGGVTVAVGKREKIFDLKQIRVVSGPTDAGEAQPHAPGDAPDAADTPAVRLVNVPPLQAINSLTNPRRRRGLDVDSLRTLADSIIAHGLGNPILVRPVPPSRLEETSGMDPRPAFEVIAGERRWRAAQMAELQTMPMVVRHMDDQAVLEMQLVENIEREDLDPMEEAEGFALLREKLGYTVEQIAEKMGRGRGTSYVHKRMKLLDLTPESREAMYEGTLQLSTGLLVSRLSPKDQVAAVKLIKSMARKLPNGQSEPAPFREVVRSMFNKFNLLLGQAPFAIDDPGLVMTAGPCTTCPKRTGANPDLFGDADQNAENQCTDSSCWADKKTAHVARAVADAQARGLTVMDEAEAAKLLPYPHSSATYLPGYEKITNTAYTVPGADGGELDVTFEDAMRAKGRKAPKPIVVVHPHTGKVFEVIPQEVANNLVPPEPDGQPEGKKGARPLVETAPMPEEHRALRDQHVRRALFVRLFDSVRARPRTVDDLRLAAITVMCQADDAHPHTEEFMGWVEARDADDAEAYLREKIESLDADQLGQLITMAAMEEAIDFYNGHIQSHEQEAQFFQAQGIDILAVRDKVQEDLQRQNSQPTREATDDEEGMQDGIEDEDQGAEA